jgi:hypothetical protein
MSESRDEKVVLFPKSGGAATADADADTTGTADAANTAATEENIRRQMAEAQRLANLAPGEYLLWAPDSAKRLGMPVEQLIAAVKAILAKREKEANEAKAEDRQRERREERERERKQARAEKDAARKFKERQAALKALAKLPSAEREVRLADLAKRLDENVETLRAEFEVFVGVDRIDSADVGVDRIDSADVRAEAWSKCEAFVRKPNILDEFATDLTGAGLVGERRAAKLLYLSLTSRLLARPVSIGIKGVSSAGKSYAVETVLKFFPPEAYHVLTGMSERTLVYSRESFVHRILILYETAALNSGFAAYLMRSLLSENRLRYETVVAGTTRVIEREGPTALISTSTSLHLDSETETRMLGVTVTDTQEQTAGVLRQLAAQDDDDGGDGKIDLDRWRALQMWLTTGSVGVVIPFADRLAELVPPVAVRLRRDFRTVLTLIRAHTLLHQETRQKDAAGRIVATLKDYAAVRDLVADLVAEEIDAQVKPETREVVKLVRKLIAKGREEVRQVDLMPHLQLDKSSLSRRVAAALDAGFLRNRERSKYRPARLVLGDPLPEEVDILPSPDRLRGCTGLGEEPQSNSEAA